MMTGDTILVIDADMATEDKIVSTLEAEGYIVFASSGSKINAGMAKKFRPALIFLKPLAPSAAGFEVCRTIHTMEAFRDVPIVILASLKGPIDSRYTAYYGIVDFLRLTFTPEELIEKTFAIMDQRQAVNASSGTETVPAETQSSSAEEEVPNVTEGPDDDLQTAGRSETEHHQVQPTAQEEWHDDDIAQPVAERSELTENLYVASRAGRRSSRQSSLKVILLGMTAVIALVVGGFVLYRLYLAPQKAVTKTTPPVESRKQQAGAEQKPDTAPQSSSLSPAPIKVPEPVPLPSAMPFYAVQVGAFKTEATAEALAQKFKGKGYEAFVQRGAARDSSVVYRVLIGRLGDRKEAATLAAAIGTKERIKTTIFNGK